MSPTTPATPESRGNGSRYTTRKLWANIGLVSRIDSIRTLGSSLYGRGTLKLNRLMRLVSVFAALVIASAGAVVNSAAANVGVADSAAENSRANRSAAPDDCSSHQLADQKQDEETLRRVERDWLVSELHGDVDRISCLIDAQYIEVGIDGKIGTKADILKGAAKNKGSNQPIPTVNWKFIVRGAAATAYAVQQRQDLDGKPVQVAFSDTFVFRDGAWHPYFSTQAVSSQPPRLKQ
jgi:hypothetical protein